MRKYIMIAQTISTMGGGQLYAKNKINYMKEYGYDSYVISLKGGKVLIDDLLEYEKKYIDYFSVNPLILSNKKIDKIINKFIKIVGNLDEDTIIESNTYPGILWSEIIARKYNCRHFIYIIEERLPKIDDYMKKYFVFKRKRNELNGIKDETYEMIFGHLPEKDNYHYHLQLVCTNVVEDCENEKVNCIEYSDFNICTIGRMGKPYVPTLMDEVIKFAINHSNINITYIMTGDCKNKFQYKKIKKLFEKINNIKLYLLGNLYPIPIKFLKKIDVFISSAGSVRVSANIGKPTIVIDGRDYNSIGIYNYDTHNALFRKDEPKISISEELNYLYKGRLYKKIKIEKSNNIEEKIDEVLLTHLKQYDMGDKKHEYFDFSNYKLTTKKKIVKIVVTLFGAKVFRKIQEKMSKRGEKNE